ncbi:M24 family metallopeptidase [Candidatus Micrarchaeota archaeon]|nr:M24 family metallopeptidase [Candidatus Micrarchaeota archaeon]
MMLLYRGDEFDSNFYYHSGVDIDHSFLLLGNDGKEKTLLTSVMNERIAKANFRGKVITYKNALEALTTFIYGRKVKKINKKRKGGFDGSAMNASMAHRLGKICKLTDESVKLMEMRSKKDENEINKTKKAVKLTKEIFDSLDFKKAKTELGVEKQIRIATIEMGLEQAFDPIVATDKNTSYPHYRAQNKKLGKLILIDYGVRWDHYCSDLTHCFILDKDKKKLGQYENLQNICYEIVDSLPDLPTGKDVAQLANQLIAKAKFPKMIHSIGHGVGLDIHEFPRLGMKSDDRITSGNILAIEPAFYLKQYGMRFEETVVVRKGKAQVF